MITLVTDIVRKLVDDPTAVKVSMNQTEAGASVISIKAAPADMGKIIGRAGRNIQAIRTLLQSIGTRQGVYVIVEIMNAPKRTRGHVEADR